MIITEDFTQGVGAILDASDDVTYLGYPRTGTTATSEARWRIKKIETSVEDGKSTTIFKWADGDLNYDNVFDDCESLSYQFLK